MKTESKIKLKLEKKLKNSDAIKFMSYSDSPIISYNLRKFKAFSLLGLTKEEILLQTYNEKRYNLSPQRSFNYNPASLFVHEYRSLKRCAKFIFILEKLLKKIIYKNNFDKDKLKELFINNFADFGLFLTFYDFCYRKNIQILEIEPKILTNNKKLDLKIKIDKRDIFVELFSPIESLIRGKELELKINEEIKNHKLENFNQPIIFVINVAEPYWSGNGLNRGCISDEMFFRIKNIFNRSIPKNSFNPISAFLIKYADTLNIFVNKTSYNPLTADEIKILTKPFLLQKIKEVFINA